jgi:hypothetical protein
MPVVNLPFGNRANGTDELPTPDQAAHAAGWAARRGLLDIASALLDLAKALEQCHADTRTLGQADHAWVRTTAPTSPLHDGARRPNPYATAICRTCLLDIYSNELERSSETGGRWQPTRWRHKAGDPILNGPHDADPSPDTIRQSRHVPGTDARPGDDGNTSQWDAAFVPDGAGVSHAPNICAACGNVIVWKTDGKSGWWGHTDDVGDLHEITPAH